MVSGTHLKEGGGDGQVRVVPETHGENGVYLPRLHAPAKDPRH
jgi:hypothetical protein